MDVNHWLETCYMLLRAYRIAILAQRSLLIVECIRDRLLYTDAALLPFGKQLKTQLSVMGMSLRIWT